MDATLVYVIDELRDALAGIAAINWDNIDTEEQMVIYRVKEHIVTALDLIEED